MAAGRKKKADGDLVLALACGASPESAAQKTGLSPRTVYRRLADPAFRERVTQVRADLVRRAAAMLTAAGMGAVKTLTTLQESAPFRVGPAGRRPRRHRAGLQAARER